jgi:hypothetical protein
MLNHGQTRTARLLRRLSSERPSGKRPAASRADPSGLAQGAAGGSVPFGDVEGGQPRHRLAGERAPFGERSSPALPGTGFHREYDPRLTDQNGPKPRDDSFGSPTSAKDSSDLEPRVRRPTGPQPRRRSPSGVHHRGERSKGRVERLGLLRNSDPGIRDTGLARRPRTPSGARVDATVHGSQLRNSSPGSRAAANEPAFPDPR